MKFLIFIPPKDFKDESIAMFKMFFDKWNVDYQITSYSNKDCVGHHGAVYRPSINTNRIDPAEYDGIILIDGQGIETYKLPEFRPLLDLMIKFNNGKKYIGSVGNATMIVARANLIKDKKIAMPKEREAIRTIELFKGIPSDQSIEIEDNIITIAESNNIEEPVQKILEHLRIK